MIRIILFLLLIAAAAVGATWVANQPGDVELSWAGWHASMTLPVFALLLGATIVTVLLVWAVLRGLWLMPGQIRRRRRERRAARGRHAITQGLLAIGQGDPASARAHAIVARRHAAQDPLSLLLHAQSAQLNGDRAGAQRAFRAMVERGDTKLLGLRGLFIEAQRADDPSSAVMIAEEALKLTPSSTWASHAMLGFRCAQSDWSGALAILDTNFSSGLIDKFTFRRQRGVLLTARAMELEHVDRDQSRDSVMEAIKLAPTLVPAAVLASKYESEANRVKRAMRIVETAWLAQPHPDLADAYAHVKLGDAARQRLLRIEALAAKAPGHLESALAIARAAIDTTEYARAREVLEPFIAAPTQRVAMLMAEVERTEHGDTGKARAWTLRAVRALHDPAWTADGYVSTTWRPVSPVTGRLDAFQWQTPVAALPSDKSAAIEPTLFEEELPAPHHNVPARLPAESSVKPDADSGEPAPIEPIAGAAPDDSASVTEGEPLPASGSVRQPSSDDAPAAVPLFRARQDLSDSDPPKTTRSGIPPVTPIVRAPDDPGVDDEGANDEFTPEDTSPPAQTGGWRGFLSR
jgi:HemY protein